MIWGNRIDFSHCRSGKKKPREAEPAGLESFLGRKEETELQRRAKRFALRV